MNFNNKTGLMPSQLLNERQGSEIGYGDLEYFGNLVFATIMPTLAKIHRVHLYQAGTKPDPNIAGLKIAVDMNDSPAEIASEIVRLVGSFAAGVSKTTGELMAGFKEPAFKKVISDVGRSVGESFITRNFSGLGKYIQVRRGMKYRAADKADEANNSSTDKKYSEEQFRDIWEYQALTGRSVYPAGTDEKLLKKKQDLWNGLRNIQTGYDTFTTENMNDLYQIYKDIVDSDGEGDSGDEGEEGEDGQEGSGGSGGDSSGDKKPGKAKEKPDDKGEDKQEPGKEPGKKPGKNKSKDNKPEKNEPEKSDGEDGEDGQSGISLSDGDKEMTGAPPDSAGYVMSYTWRKHQVTVKPPRPAAKRIASALRPRFAVRKSKLAVIGGHYADRRKLAEFQFPYLQNIVAAGGQSKLSMWIFLDGSSSMGSYADSLFDLSNIAAQAIALAMKDGDPEAEVRFCIFDGNVHYTEGNSTDLLFSGFNPQGGTTFMWLSEVSQNYKGDIVVITDGEGATPTPDNFVDKTAKNRIHFIRIGSDYARYTRTELEKIAKSVVYCRDLGELPAIMASSIRPANV